MSVVIAENYGPLTGQYSVWAGQQFTRAHELLNNELNENE